MTRSLLVLGLALLAHLAIPTPAQGQNPLELLRNIRQGGGWVSIPVTAGAATMDTDTIRTFGLALDGCLTVWPGHSGTWTVEASDPLNDQRLEAVARPGEGVRFSYQAGPKSVLGVSVEWSERRDTVLHVWVGVDSNLSDRDACVPRYRAQPGGDGIRRR